MNELRHFRPIYIMSPGKIAGAEKVVITGLKALLEIGINPLIIVIREERNPQLAHEFITALDSRIEYREVSSIKAIDWKLVQEIKRVLKEFKDIPFIIHTHGFKALVAAKLIFSKLPHIHTHHGNTGHTFKVRCYETLALTVMRTCTHVVAVSKQMEQLLLKELYPVKKISAIDNMLSLSNAQEVAESVATKKLNLNSIRLIFIGRISQEKGLSDFLRAWSKSYNKNSFTLTVLGDGPLKEQCQELARELSLAELCYFEGFTKNPASFLADADLLVMPSHTEGLPMTLIEAASCGLPIMANDVGAISQIVEDKCNGLLIKMKSKEVSDLDCWRASLEEINLHIESWKNQAQEKSAFIREHYSAKTWALKTKELYLRYLF